MKQCAILIAAIGLMTGCTHSGSGSAARYSSGAVGITPLDGRQNVSNEERRQAAMEAAAGEVTEIPLYREELQVGKRQVSKGNVVIRKVVETQMTNVPVQLRREEIVVERIQPGDWQEAANLREGARPFEEREVVLELNKEVPTIEKSAEIAEVVQARKTFDTERQTVVDTVRSETIDVDRQMAQARPAQEEMAVGGPAASTTESARSDAPRERLEQDQANVYLYREELNVGTREVPSGRVVLRKSINSERVSQPIELRSEDVQIERGVATGQAPDAATHAFQSREIVIPLYEEVPVKQKEVRLAEVIRARKQIETEQQNVDGQVRHERLDVVRNVNNDRGAIETSAQGAPANVESGRAEAAPTNPADAWEGRERFSGQITTIDLDSRQVTVRNQEGESRTFTFTDKPVLTIKENRNPSLWNFKPGYPVTIGHRGGVAEVMIRADAPEVR